MVVEVRVVRDAEEYLQRVAQEVLVPHPQECVLCYVARMVEEHGCDSTLRWVGRFRELRSPLATGLEATRSASEARRQQAEALAATLEASRIAVSGQTELKDRSVQLVRLEHDIAVLQTAVDLSTATIARLVRS